MILYISADVLMSLWRPGSHDPPWAWEDERRYVEAQPAWPEFLDDVATNGIREPVLLGYDGRVWDGHHRVLAAQAFAQAVPFEIVRDGPHPEPDQPLDR